MKKPYEQVIANVPKNPASEPDRRNETEQPSLAGSSNPAEDNFNRRNPNRLSKPTGRRLTQ